jgi:amino acid transporter
MPQDSDIFQVRYGANLPLWSAIARGLGVVTAGIALALLGSAAAAGGPLTAPAIVAAAVLVTINHLGYTDLALRAGHRGGAYTLVYERFGGGSLTFLTGWALALGGIGLGALLLQSAAGYLALFLGDMLRLPISTNLLAMALAALLILDSAAGRRWGQRLPLTLPGCIKPSGNSSLCTNQ